MKEKGEHPTPPPATGEKQILLHTPWCPGAPVPRCPHLPQSSKLGLRWEGLLRASPTLSPGPSLHRLQVQCGLLDLVTGLGLPGMGAARGPRSGHQRHLHAFPTSALAPRHPGTGRRRHREEPAVGSALYQGPQGRPSQRARAPPEGRHRPALRSPV